MPASSHARTAAGFPAWLVQASLDAAQALPRPAVFGISGVQGSGKSTLAAQVAQLGSERGLRVAVLSLDDFYLSRARRSRLAIEVHPLLATRGPPGTHDLALALEVLGQLRAGACARLPRFDKLTDDHVPEAHWPRTGAPVDLVIFEGWMLGVPPQPDAELVEPVNALERNEDPDGTWRSWCNGALTERYPALWQHIDSLWMLKAPSFDVVPAWRWQQERALQARGTGGPTMGPAEVERFVQLFERVSRHALRALPPLARRVVPLDEQRRPLRNAGRGPGVVDPVTGPRR